MRFNRAGRRLCSRRRALTRRSSNLERWRHGLDLTALTVPKCRRGSPAHAGIVPSPRDLRSPRRRFPRTRGDRPELGDDIQEIFLVPPHTRGSSRVGEVRQRHGEGSPAHAGIVPGRIPTGHARARFPRTRGDRPRAAIPRSTRQKVPPHTRGSSLVGLVRVHALYGSPAHAGIVPFGTRSDARA